jgi:hypothetical protein
MLKFQRAWCVGNIYLATQTNQCTTNQSDPVENVIIAHFNINSSHLTMSVSSHGPSFCIYLMFLFSSNAERWTSLSMCTVSEFIIERWTVICLIWDSAFTSSLEQANRSVCSISISRTLTILHFAPAAVFQVPLVEGERIASW